MQPLSKACYRMRGSLEQLLIPVQQLLSLLVKSVQEAARQCLLFFKYVGESLGRLMSSACRAVWQNQIYPLITMLKRLWKLCLLPNLQSLQIATVTCITGVIPFGRWGIRIVSSFLGPICTSLGRIAETFWRSFVLSGLRSLQRATRICIAGFCATVEAILNPIWTSVRRVFMHLRLILGRTFNKVATIVGPPIVAIFDQFIKRYWKLVPTLLIFNGALSFVKASMSTKTNAVSMVQYLLGAWALLLIGLTMANAVFATAGGSLMRQHVYIVDSAFLSHVDLHLGYAVSRTVLSGWHALSTVLWLALHAIDAVIRKSSRGLWNAYLLLHKHAMLRVYRGAKHLFDTVWNSPILGMLVSSSFLCVMYLLHVGAIHLPQLLFSTKIHATALHSHFEVFFTSSLRYFLAMQELFKPPLLFVANFMWDTYGPVVWVESSSPSSALGCWVFSCIIKWTCTRVRLKLFAIPALYLYVSGLADEELLRAFYVSFAVWILLSTLVDRYETAQRGRVDQDLPSFLLERRPVPADDRAPQQIGKKYEQSECSICLESLDDAARNLPKVALPCGHEFHRACIEDWLQIQDRCPVCRRAAHGFDRVLEVVF